VHADALSQVRGSATDAVVIRHLGVAYRTAGHSSLPTAPPAPVFRWAGHHDMAAPRRFADAGET
jgi:hypothetical protein